MAKITLHGNEINTNSDLPVVGSQAPDFLLVNSELDNVSLANYNSRKKLMNIVPSLDTPTCALSTKKFNDLAANRKDVAFLMISTDLPFAMSRFCLTEETKNVTSLSIMRSQQFSRDYGVLIEDGPLTGITARAIIVLDENNKILHTELVSEIANEPNYDAAMAVL